MSAETGTGIQMVGRITAILDAVAALSHDGAKPADIIAATGLQRATVHRLLKGLVDGGMLEMSGEAGRYFLGPRLIGYAAAAGDRFDLVERSAQSRQRLATITEDTVFLLLRVGDRAACVARTMGRFPIRNLTLSVGDTRPLGIGAGSIAILMSLPDEEVEALIAAQAQDYAAFGLDGESVRRLVALGRQLGYALDEENLIPGHTAVGMPLIDRRGRPVAGLAVAAISPRMAEPRRTNMVARLAEEVRRLESDLRTLRHRSDPADHRAHGA